MSQHVHFDPDLGGAECPGPTVWQNGHGVRPMQCQCNQSGKQGQRLKNDPVMWSPNFRVSNTTLTLELSTWGPETEYKCKDKMPRLLTFDP